jgi:cytochrome c556
MRIIGALAIAFLLVAGATVAQVQETAQPVGTMSELMVSMTYPAANEIFLAVARGGPKDAKEWMAVQRSAVLLAESGNALMMKGRARDEGDWMKDAKALVDVGGAAYRAARAKDANALAAVNNQLNASCTNCHKQYRPNVYPRP